MTVKPLSLWVFMLVFFGFAHKAYCQQETPARMVIFKFSPLVMFEPVGGYQVGLEFPVKPNFSVQGEFAYLPYFWDTDYGEMRFFSKRENFNAWAIKAEARYYFTDVEGNSIFGNVYEPDLQGIYMASQIQLKRITEVDSSYQWSFSGEEHFEKYTLTTTIVKTNAKIGYQQIFANGFVIDCYTGIGFRFWDTEIDRTNIAYRDRYGYSPLNFALGVKLGWAF